MSENREVAAVVWARELDHAAQFADRLGAELHCVHYAGRVPLVAPVRYIPQFFKTLQVLFRQRPAVVYVINPPIFAALSTWLYCVFTGSEYVMDTHSPALYSRRWSWTRPLQRALARPALVNITDQERFRQLFEAWGAKALIIEKPQRQMEQQPAPTLEGTLDITVVNTFEVDEPLEPILEAAEQLPDTRFFVLGDTARAPADVVESAPPNVIFTGWLGQDAYWQRLRDSHAVMTLTIYPYSLLAGGHDAVTAGRPMILSDQPALTDYFTQGAVFVDNTAEGIARGAREVRACYGELVEAVIDLRQQKRKTWEENFQQLETLVKNATANGHRG